MNFLEKKGSTRELVINILCEEWPLSLKEISLRVNKCGKSISYQAVHKIVKQLESDSVLLCKGKNYELNKVWVSNLKQFSNDLYERIESGKSKFNIRPDFVGTQTTYFSDYSAFCVDMADTLRKRVLVGNGPNIVVSASRHLYWPLRFNFTDFEIFRRMTKAFDNGFMIAKNNSPLDQWLKNTWQKGGWPNIKLGVPIEGDQDIAAQGDSVIEINYSEETKLAIDKIYNRTAGLSGLFKEYFTNSGNRQQMKIEVKITKNSLMADLIRKQVQSYFINQKNEKEEAGAKK